MTDLPNPLRRVATAHPPLVVCGSSKSRAAAAVGAHRRRRRRRARSYLVGNAALYGIFFFCLICLSQSRTRDEAAVYEAVTRAVLGCSHIVLVLLVLVTGVRVSREVRNGCGNERAAPSEGARCSTCAH